MPTELPPPKKPPPGLLTILYWRLRVAIALWRHRRKA
jgi:hypothetical protein